MPNGRGMYSSESCEENLYYNNKKYRTKYFLTREMNDSREILLNLGNGKNFEK